MSILAAIHSMPDWSNNKMYFPRLAMRTGPASVNSARFASSKPSNFRRFDLAQQASLVRFLDGATAPDGLNSTLCSASLSANLRRTKGTATKQDLWRSVSCPQLYTNCQ